MTLLNIIFHIPSPYFLSPSLSLAIIQNSFREILWIGSLLSHSMSSHWHSSLNEYRILSSQLLSLRTLNIFLPYLLASVCLVRNLLPIWFTFLCKCILQKPNSNQKEMYQFVPGKPRGGAGLKHGWILWPKLHQQDAFPRFVALFACVSFNMVDSYCTSEPSFLCSGKITTRSCS